MGHDDFSTNEDFAAAVAQAQGDIEGVTSMQGTSVDPLGHLQDATILGLSGVPYNETLLAQLARTDPEFVRDLMRARTYMAGEGLLGQGASGQRQISLMDSVGGGDSTIHFGQRMGEPYDDFLDRIISEPDKFLSEDETTTGKNKQMVDRPPKNVYERLAPVRDRPEAIPLATPKGTTDIFDIETGKWKALTKTEDEKTEEEKINSLINQLSRPKVKEGQAWRKSAEDELQKAIALETDTPTYSWPTIPTVQDTQATVMDEGIAAGLGMTAKESIERTRVLNTANILNPPHYPGTRPLDIDVPKEKPTKKDTKKTNYGAWKGLINDLTPKQNLDNKKTHDNAWKTDFEKRWGPMGWWGLTRPVVNGKQLSHKEMSLRNQMTSTDKFSKVYDSVIGVNPALKFGANLIGKSIGTIGGGLQKFVNKKGLGNADTFDQTLKKMQEGEFEEGAEVAPTHPRETVSGGFWGLMSFAKQNKKLFESLSGDELWALVSDPDEFWRFYEDALNAQ